MAQPITELVCILDRSGSMSGLEADTIGGFNAMINKQKETKGTVLVTTILFDDTAVMLHDRLSLSHIRPLTKKDYVPGGCTALLDAVGAAIDRLAIIHAYARPEDVPAHTLFVIITDGEENASCRYTYADVKRAMKQQQEHGWEFLFLGANIDAAETAENLGIDHGHASTYHADSIGTRLNFHVLDKIIHHFRKSGEIQDDCFASIDEDFESRKSGSQPK